MPVHWWNYVWLLPTLNDKLGAADRTGAI